MKKVILFTLMLFIIWAGPALSYDDGHSMVTGIVKQISSGYIVIDDVTYALSPKCKVEIEYNVENAFYLKPARLVDINRGYSVNAVKLANTITEIKIERWKR
jgi:hypothetical protein